MSLAVLLLIVLASLPLLAWQQWKRAKEQGSGTAAPLKHLAICTCLLLLSLGLCGIGIESGGRNRWLAAANGAGLLLFGLSLLWGAISLISLLLASTSARDKTK